MKSAVSQEGYSFGESSTVGADEQLSSCSLIFMKIHVMKLNKEK